MKHFIVLVFAAASAIGWAQNQPQTAPPAPQPRAATTAARTALPTYEPSELQKLKLENAQLKLVVVSLQVQPLEQKRQEQLAALSQLCEAVVRENHWPENVKCDPATLTFAQQVAKPDRQALPAPPAEPNGTRR